MFGLTCIKRFSKLTENVTENSCLSVVLKSALAWYLGCKFRLHCTHLPESVLGNRLSNLLFMKLSM